VGVIHVRVDSRLHIDVRGVGDADVERLKAVFEHKNPQHAKLKALKKPTWSEPAIIRMWKGQPGSVLAPRGGTKRVREWAESIGREVIWHDDRTAPAPDYDIFPRHNRRLYDYQEEMVAAAIERENCLLRAGTGGGKTTAAMALATRIGVPTLVIVEKGQLHDQWLERAYLELGLREGDVGIVRAGKMRLRPLTIAMQQTLWKLPDDDWKIIASYFGAVICDEVQKFAASTFVNVIDRIPAKYRIGMSADESRKDRKEFLVYDQFGAVAHEVPRARLNQLGTTVDVEVRALESGTLASWYRTASAAETDFTKLLDQLEIEPARNALIADIAAEEVRRGHQVLLFSHRRAHCERLCAFLAARGVQTGLMMGGPKDAAEARRTAQAMRDGSLRCGVGTIQAIGTGIDLPAISRGVLATPIPANRQLFGQVNGRLCRSAKGKTDSILYVVHDSDAFGDYPLRNLRKWSPTVTWQDATGAIIPIDERLARGSGHGDQVTLEQMLG
jgi:superfamily II DNA or RNA helicase